MVSAGAKTVRCSFLQYNRHENIKVDVKVIKEKRGKRRDSAKAVVAPASFYVRWKGQVRKISLSYKCN